MNHRPTLLIIDVATSGFTPDKSTILEVACILADAGTLDIIDAGAWVVAHSPDAPPSVPDFHEPLLRECISGADGISSMKATDGFLYSGQWQNAEIVCNRALDFDMRFLAAYMPLMHKALTKNKQHLELKALDILHCARGGVSYKSDIPRTFRAADDAVAAYEELCFLWNSRAVKK